MFESILRRVTLAAGTRLGPYEIIAPLGEGGMGEVYRARDARLDRVVAIKVLSETLAGDSSFRQRFQTEARAISQLSHPHICTLHDIGEHHGATFLVMELIEGETLADRLRRQPGQALPVVEALRLGGQIAVALAAAHRRGIVHRDLKPGNVMLAKASGGHVDAKLLDFGLAKVQPKVNADSATTTPPGVTAPGTVLGTFQYMSPEQIEGVEADARSDVFALGCVLYEMLSGRPAFEGKSRTAVMASILERDPVAVSTVQPLVPALVSNVVARCLAKDPEARWQGAADVSAALRLADGTAAATATPVPDRSTAWRVGIFTSVITAIAIAVLAVPAMRATMSPDTVAPEMRFEIRPPHDAALSPSPASSTSQLALAPDGQRVAFVASRRPSPPQIWIRRFDAIEAQPLPGTDHAAFPFWSADGRSIGFFADGKLKRVDVSGGAPLVLATAGLGRGGSWSRDDVIVYSPSPAEGIWKIAAGGGTPVAQTPSDLGGDSRAYPHFLADGRRFIYYTRSNQIERQGIYVRTLDSPDETLVMSSNGIALPIPGHLLFVRDGILFAQPIDDATVTTRGEPIRIADGVGFALGTSGYSPMSAVGTTLAFGPTVRLTTGLQWFDRSGAANGGIIASGDYRSPRLSPDNRRVALTILEDGTTGPDVWTLDLQRGAFTRVSRDPATDWFPAWSADGQYLYFGSARSRATTIFGKAPGATQPEAALAPTDTARYPLDTTRDRVLFQAGASSAGLGGYDIGLMNSAEPRTLSPFLATPSNEVQARLSPNARWVAYASDESGRFEVYVRDYPGGRDQWTISTAGGMQPEWRRDGRELFYVSADRKLMSVAVSGEGTAFTAQVPRPLFSVDLPEASAPYPGDYAVSADGQRFLINRLIAQPPVPLTVVLNWTAARPRQNP